MPVDAEPRIGLDTSVAVPLLVQTHTQHQRLVAWWAGRRVALCGHALAETYSVLTRLPGDLRLLPGDAARLISARFADPLLLDALTQSSLPSLLAELDVAGGAVYDALVGLAARENECRLATRDQRALATYRALDVDVEVVA